jgi:iron-sulfur cluster repair protein YtfE (RIC family)
MLREEKNLFPRIEELDLHPHKVRAGSISRPLLNEFIEHDIVHERIAKIRELALRLRSMEGPDVQLLDEIEELYRAVHRHIHLENNVLIPLVIDLENRLKASRQANLAV